VAKKERIIETTLRLPETLHAAVKELAAQRDLSLQQLITATLRELIAREKASK
jgi:predicted HicB family RNase H-like nuclease